MEEQRATSAMHDQTISPYSPVFGLKQGGESELSFTLVTAVQLLGLFCM